MAFRLGGIISSACSPLISVYTLARGGCVSFCFSYITANCSSVKSGELFDEVAPSSDREICKRKFSLIKMGLQIFSTLLVEALTDDYIP